MSFKLFVLPLPIAADNNQSTHDKTLISSSLQDRPLFIYFFVFLFCFLYAALYSHQGFWNLIKIQTHILIKDIRKT